MTLEFRSGRNECRQMDALLPLYVDGEANAADRARVAAHLERCAACRAEAAAQASVRGLLVARREQLRGEAPTGLAAELRRQARAPRLTRLGAGGRLSALAAAAAVVLAVGGTIVWTTNRSSVVLAAQLTLDHIKCFMIDGDDHAGHFTAEAAEARMEEAFGWSVPIPPPAAPADVHLVAVRRCLYGDGMVAHVLYRVHGAPVSLFVMPGRAAAPVDLSAFGRHAEVRTQGDVTYVLVAPDGLVGVAAAVGLAAE
jgi:anti-sigma factor RsiW